MLGGFRGGESMSDLLRVIGLTKKFGDFTAVDGIDFSVARERCWAFLDLMGQERQQQ